MQVDTGASTSSTLLLSAFHLGGWLNWLRTGLHYPSSAPPSVLPHSLHAAHSHSANPSSAMHSSPATAEVQAHIVPSSQDALQEFTAPLNSLKDAHSSVGSDMEAGLQDATDKYCAESNPQSLAHRALSGAF
jgi:hypothetical protein